MLDLPTKAEDIIAVSSKENTNIDLLVEKLESNKQKILLPAPYVQVDSVPSMYLRESYGEFLRIDFVNILSFMGLHRSLKPSKQ